MDTPALRSFFCLINTKNNLSPHGGEWRLALRQIVQQKNRGSGLATYAANHQHCFILFLSQEAKRDARRRDTLFVACAVRERDNRSSENRPKGLCAVPLRHAMRPRRVATDQPRPTNHVPASPTPTTNDQLPSTRSSLSRLSRFFLLFILRRRARDFSTHKTPNLTAVIFRLSWHHRDTRG